VAGQLRVLRRRIRTVNQTKQITRAMELVATSRIAKAQQRVEAARPYSNEITRVLSALASNSTRCWSPGRSRAAPPCSW
jgi:F-type H+-transporting ATPase subunit gamma